MKHRTKRFQKGSTAMATLIVILVLIIMGSSLILLTGKTNNNPNQPSTGPSGTTTKPSPHNSSNGSGIQMGLLTPPITQIEISGTPAPSSGSCSLPTPGPGGISPFIFGTNTGSQFMQSTTTQSLFKQIHVQFARVGFLSPNDTTSLSPSEVSLFQKLRDMCITPLTILHYHVNGGDPTAVDTVIVRGIYAIMGTRPVYFEFSNEPDIAGIRADQYQYVTAWNHVIAALKNIDPYAKFGGPVVSQMLPDYISYFYHNAKPKPDFVSWHEYNCGNNDSAATCIAHLSDWKRNVGWLKSAFQKNGDTVPPMVISEWNYDSVVNHPDPRATTSFLQTYMQTAFTDLAQNGIFAATHFKSTNFTSEYLLINPNNTLTAEGEEFQTMYEKLIGK